MYWFFQTLGYGLESSSYASIIPIIQFNLRIMQKLDVRLKELRLHTSHFCTIVKECTNA
jgi:hypothetical protein